MLLDYYKLWVLWHHQESTVKYKYAVAALLLMDFHSCLLILVWEVVICSLFFWKMPKNCDFSFLSQCEALRAEATLLPGMRAELESLRRRHTSALELMGERDEEVRVQMFSSISLHITWNKHRIGITIFLAVCKSLKSGTVSFLKYFQWGQNVHAYELLCTWSSFLTSWNSASLPLVLGLHCDPFKSLYCVHHLFHLSTFPRQSYLRLHFILFNATECYLIMFEEVLN